MSAHSKLGASSMHRWAECPGSVRLCETVPPAPSSVYADEGHKAHEIAARVIDTGHWPADLDDESRAAILVYVDAVFAVWKPGFPRLVEHRFDLSSIYPGCFGTADCVVFDPVTKTLYVFDLKFGAGIPVAVVDEHGKPNSQLMYYGLGALLTAGFTADTVELVIAQPRCEHRDGPVRRFRLPAIEMIDFAADLKTFCEATEKPNAPLVSGSHCRFCPAAAVCPKLQQTALEVAQDEFVTAGLVPDTYDPVKLAETLDKLETIEGYIKAVRQFAYAEAERGRCAPGYKLVEKVARRKWRDESQVPAALAERAKLPMDMLFEDPTVKSVAAIEKMLSKKTFEQVAADLVVKESSGLTLVHESDKRPAVLVSPEAEFQTLLEAPETAAMSIFD